MNAASADIFLIVRAKFLFGIPFNFKVTLIRIRHQRSSLKKTRQSAGCLGPQFSPKRLGPGDYGQVWISHLHKVGWGKPSINGAKARSGLMGSIAFAHMSKKLHDHVKFLVFLECIFIMVYISGPQTWRESSSSEPLAPLAKNLRISMPVDDIHQDTDSMSLEAQKESPILVNNINAKHV